MPRRMREALEKAEAKIAADVLNSAAPQVVTPPAVIMAQSNVLVLFGSQTGCAEEVRRFAPHAVAQQPIRDGPRPRPQVAKQVVEELTRQHVPSECLPLDEYDVTKLPHERCVVFVASTTGEGTVPDNMRSFWRFLLRKDLPPGSLGAMRHACFGLGDSSYPKFNFAAKRLHRRLLQLGSTALLELGLADDQDDLGLDQTLAPWLEALRARLLELRPMAKGLVPIPRSQSLPPRYRLLEGEAFPVGEPAPPPSVPPAVDGPPSQAHPFYARLV